MSSPRLRINRRADDREGDEKVVGTPCDVSFFEQTSSGKNGNFHILGVGCGWDARGSIQGGFSQVGRDTIALTSAAAGGATTGTAGLKPRARAERSC